LRSRFSGAPDRNLDTLSFCGWPERSGEILAVFRIPIAFLKLHQMHGNLETFCVRGGRASQLAVGFITSKMSGRVPFRVGQQSLPSLVSIVMEAHLDRQREAQAERDTMWRTLRKSWHSSMPRSLLSLKIQSWIDFKPGGTHIIGLRMVFVCFYVGCTQPIP
jgi:hypothetical protein